MFAGRSAVHRAFTRALHACDVSSGASQLVDVLRKIRDSVTTTNTRVEVTTTVEELPVPCQWELPVTNEWRFDKDLVNVELTSPGGKVVFGRIETEDDCVERGWLYDDYAKPTKIIACDETCALIESTPQAKVDIVVGCKPQPLD